MSRTDHAVSTLRVTLATTATLLCHCSGSPGDPASSSEALSAPSADLIAEERRHHHKHHHHDAGVEPDAALDASDGAVDAASPTDLAASVTGFNFSPECNDPPPAAQTFTLTNRGRTAATWTATFPSYLTVSPTMSTLRPGDSVTISVDVGAVGTGGIIPETPGQMYTLSIETASQTIDIGITSVIDGCLFEGTPTTVNFGDVPVGNTSAYVQVPAASTSCNSSFNPQLLSFDAGAAFQVGVFAGYWPVTFSPTTAGPQTGTFAFNTGSSDT